MSNPAPTLNQINAFNATIGTTIDFNIIGGTELVRSNRIYIYDLSDNSLICTHLYVSTESIHELPANTDSSIVYESGKSSADFVNGAQYYAQIQTFTDVGGTQGGSGLSIAKLFWCLPTPTLTLATIPTTISTTSYNVSATYTPNTSGGATNEIQEFQFNLYSAIGALLQTSGVVLYGDGVDLSYNFSGLEVDSTYYVTLDVTTTQGMNVSAQSNTFTVSIDTPTMGSASVVNNACDGYISVTSNLSSEYSHEQSVDAGEVMSFTTDSPNDVKELQVDFHPIQDGTPWMSQTPDTTPYLFRASPQLGHSYNSKLPTIVGGTVAWNQLYDLNRSVPSSDKGLTLTKDIANAKFTLNGTTTAKGNSFGLGVPNVQNHVYFLSTGGNQNIPIRISSQSYGQDNSGNGTIIRNTSANATWYYVLNVQTEVGTVVSNYDIRPMLIDLTQMFGSTIADYIYSLETANAGAGVAWFRNYFPKSYYPYDHGTLRSVEGVSAHETVGFNQWDISTDNIGKAISTDGSLGNNSVFNTSDYIRVIPNATYYFHNVAPSANALTFAQYDSDKNFVKTTSISGATGTDASGSAVMEGNTHFIRCARFARQNEPCINLSDPSRNGEYEPYQKHTYPLDSSLTLRGVPKLVDGKLAFDGDVYPPSGEVQRRYGLRAYQSGDESLADAITDGTNTVYKLATPTTETAEPYQEVQICSPYGTEEYVTTSIVPVGHETWYADIYPISGYDEVSADVVGKNLLDPTYRTHTLQNNVRYYRDGGGGIKLRAGVTYTLSVDESCTRPSGIYINTYGTSTHASLAYRYNSYSVSFTPTEDVVIETDCYYLNAPTEGIENIKVQLEFGSIATDYEPYNADSATYTADLGQTVYGGTVDLVSGVLTVTHALITINGTQNLWDNGTLTYGGKQIYCIPSPTKAYGDPLAYSDLLSDKFYSYGGGSAGIVSGRTTNGNVYFNMPSSVTSLALAYTWFENNPTQVWYKLATPQTYQLTSHQIQTLVGQNNLWHDTNGEMTIIYQLPITDLLVKRKDVSQVGSQWLTLHSVPITQAGDMDFTFIDFLNQYGKKYQYALVPVLAQNQSGVIVQIEGGYTTSDTIDSIFDGVYIADQTNVERVKAGAGYGNIEMNQNVGTIVPIGSKYPIVITNSQNQYHNGSIRGKIVPNDFYSNGNLSRIDMVNKRDELEQFLTNKRAKIIKDWNGKIWLVMILSNVDCTFDDNYGMGMVEFSADWVEIGDPTIQQDLYNAGLINVGGV